MSPDGTVSNSMASTMLQSEQQVETSSFDDTGSSTALSSSRSSVSQPSAAVSSKARKPRTVFIPYEDSSADNNTRRNPFFRVVRRTPGADARPRFPVPLDGRYDYTVESMCAAIDANESLQSAQIVELEGLRQWSRGVLHRFVLLRISRQEEDDVWIRIDRRAGMGIYQNLGRTKANDQVSYSTSRCCSEVATRSNTELRERRVWPDFVTVCLIPRNQNPLLNFTLISIPFKQIVDRQAIMSGPTTVHSEEVLR